MPPDSSLMLISTELSTGILEKLPLIFFITALLLLTGVASTKIASRFNMPVLILFLSVGILASSDMLGYISFTDSKVANLIGTIALAYILFSGGYDTRWKSIRPVFTVGGILASLGVLLTALILGVFSAWLLDAPILWGLLLAATISSTDAAAVFAILRGKGVGLRGQLSPLLEFESGSNDPMAAFLTIFLIGMIQENTPLYELYKVLPWFALRMGLGILVGYFIGKCMVKIYNRISLDYDGLYYVMGICTVLLSYGAAELVIGNGFMAVYVTGLVMGNSRFIFEKGFGRFHDGIAWLMQVTLFVMLGLLVNARDLIKPEIVGKGLCIAVFLFIIARPLATFICMLPYRKFSNKEKLFISWVGLRGGAPIVLATFPLIYDIPNAGYIFNIVFFVVLASLTVQGWTLMPFARWLHLDKPSRNYNRPFLEFETTGAGHGESRQFEIGPDCTITNKTIADVDWGENVFVMLIRRNGQYLVPRGNTLILANDVLEVLAEKNVLDDLAHLYHFDDPDEIGNTVIKTAQKTAP